MNAFAIGFLTLALLVVGGVAVCMSAAAPGLALVCATAGGIALHCVAKEQDEADEE